MNLAETICAYATLHPDTRMAYIAQTTGPIRLLLDDLARVSNSMIRPVGIIGHEALWSNRSKLRLYTNFEAQDRIRGRVFDQVWLGPGGEATDLVRFCVRGKDARIVDASTIEEMVPIDGVTEWHDMAVRRGRELDLMQQQVRRALALLTATPDVGHSIASVDASAWNAAQILSVAVGDGPLRPDKPLMIQEHQDGSTSTVQVQSPPRQHWDFVDESGNLHCNCGKGVTPPRHPDGSRDVGACPLCDGSGLWNSQTCQTCGGDGLTDYGRERNGIEHDMARCTLPGQSCHCRCASCQANGHGARR